MIQLVHLKELLKKVNDWINQFEEGYWPPLSLFTAMVEEVGELGREINHLEGFKPKKVTNPTINKEIDSLGIELADVFFSLACIANYYKIDLEYFFFKTLEKYSNRDLNRWSRG